MEVIIYTKRAYDSTRIQKDLEKIGDIKNIPVESCVKSASFGTRTYIEYKGSTSKDIECLSNNATNSEKDLVSYVLNVN